MVSDDASGPGRVAHAHGVGVADHPHARIAGHRSTRSHPPPHPQSAATAPGRNPRRRSRHRHRRPHPAIRNKGTHGGSVAYGDPAAELPAFAVLVDAQIVLSGSSGERIVSAKEFYKGLFETSINPDEILTSVKYPINQSNKKLFFDEITRRHGDYAMAGLVGSIKQKSNINEEINLVFFGTGDKPNEAPKTCEYLLKNEYNYSNIKDILKNDIEFASDISSSSDMKAHLSAILVGRMMKELN